jgi:ubiquinone biosynthesis protein
VIATVVHVARLTRAAYVFAREGVFGLVDPAPFPPAAQLALRLGRMFERPRSDVFLGRVAAALQRIGPSYVKLGQFLATRPDVVGLAMARELERLQDRLPPFPQAEAEAAIAAAFERPLNQTYASFGPAVAAASIAQVHRAEVEQAGQRRLVAVKILRPNVAHSFKVDLDAFRFAARQMEAISEEARRLRLSEVVATLTRSVAMEMDLRLEAAALSEMAQNTADDPDFRVPAIDWDRTSQEVLTMEWIHGISLNDRDKLETSHVDFVDLSRKIMQSFLRHSLRDGFFHADMHPGNLFIEDTGRLVAVDFGIMGRLGTKERRFLAEVLYGFIRRDYHRVAEVHFEAGYVPPHHSVDNFAQALRAIGEPIHNRTAQEISMARLLSLLFEVTALFDMQTRPELLLLQKTMVVAEGVARSFDPRLDIWTTAEPVVREWMERNLGPIGKIEGVVNGANDLGRILAGMPALAGRAVTLLERMDALTRNGLLLSPESIEAVGRAERRHNRWFTAGIWLIGLALVAAVWILR